MEKFSLYDLLGLVLPGALFIYFGNVIVSLFFPQSLFNIDIEKGLEIGAYLCFVLIMGAVLYTSNFYLINIKWYNKLFGMYRYVADLFWENKIMPKIMIPMLNIKANEWFKKPAFYSSDDYNKLDKEAKQNVNDLQDEFYDRMYYELEYVQKNDHPKTFQSFYFFFRQVALACVLLIVLGLILLLISWVTCNFLNHPEFYKSLLVFTNLASILVVSVILARWYRKRMVVKMYWAYFTHLNQIKK